MEEGGGTSDLFYPACELTFLPYIARARNGILTPTFFILRPSSYLDLALPFEANFSP